MIISKYLNWTALKLGAGKKKKKTDADSSTSACT
jgi:hypothetical protein